MVQITRPTENVVRETARIDQGLAGAVGRSQAQLGAAIESAGAEAFERAKAADQTAQYSNAINSATQQFTKLSQDRTAQLVDDEGNPTYATLTQDIADIGKQVTKDISSRIVDPEVAANFRTQFGGFVSNKTVMAQTQQRNQQLSFIKESIANGVQGLTEQAAQDDPIQAEAYANQVGQILDAGLASGAITPQQRTALEEGFRSAVRVEHARQQIDSDPFLAAAFIGASDTLTFEEKRKLIREAEAAVQDIEVQQAKETKELEKEDIDRKNILKSELELGILEGSVGLKEVERARDSLDPLQYLDLRKNLARLEAKNSQEISVNTEISDMIKAGEPLLDFTSAEIGDHYRERVAAENEDDQAPSIARRAAIATEYLSPVKPIQKELAFSLTNGTPEEAAEAIEAYQFIAEKSPIVLDGMDTEAAAIASSAIASVKNTTLPVADALREAREQVLNTDPNVSAERATNFKQIDKFQDKDIRNTILEDVLDAEGFLGFGRKTMAEGVVNRLRSVIRDSYMSSGSEDGALEMAKVEADKLFGESGLGESGEIMAFPPEKMFNTDTDILREDLASSLPEGLLVDDVTINSDALTRGPAGVISYNLTTKEAIGDEEIDVPLTNPVTGEILRWVPNPGIIIDKINLQEQANLRQLAKDEVADARDAQEIARATKEVFEERMKELSNVNAPKLER